MAAKSYKWTHLTRKDLVDYRKTHHISRASLADAIGVSSTSIQNWETSIAPSENNQKKLRDFISGRTEANKHLNGNGATTKKPVPSKKTSKNQKKSKKLPSADKEVVRTTGQIVVAFIASKKNCSVEEVAKLTSKLRASLS